MSAETIRLAPQHEGLSRALMDRFPDAIQSVPTAIADVMPARPIAPGPAA